MAKAAYRKFRASCIRRREFFKAAGAFSLAAVSATSALPWAVAASRTPQRVCVILLDGFGTDYYEQSRMPTLQTWAKNGFYKSVRGVMPSVTNTNLAGVCCGVYADEHGITGNSYWDAEAEQEQHMSDGNLLTAATLFQRAARFGVRSALISAKQKTIPLLRQGTTLAIGSQQPPPEVTKRHGVAPDIYSAEVNYWVWQVAIDIIKKQPKIGLVFVHTTDYPMHKFPPAASESQAHLRTIDQFLAEAAEADPDMAFFLIADHGMNFKKTVVNLNKLLVARGAPVQVAMSAERDQYPRHHSGYGGTAFIYLNAPTDARKVMQVLQGADGVEEVLTRADAATKYRLNPYRIGDLWVTATKEVVFGHSPAERGGTSERIPIAWLGSRIDCPVLYLSQCDQVASRNRNNDEPRCMQIPVPELNRTALRCSSRITTNFHLDVGYHKCPFPQNGEKRKRCAAVSRPRRRGSHLSTVALDSFFAYSADYNALAGRQVDLVLTDHPPRRGWRR